MLSHVERPVGAAAIVQVADERSVLPGSIRDHSMA
jgi:hypothetical protein